MKINRYTVGAFVGGVIGWAMLFIVSVFGLLVWKLIEWAIS